jgi:hypothetical protein
MRLWIFCLFLVGCSPATLQDLRFEAEAETRKLTAELRGISNCEDLQKSMPKLKKRYTKMALLVQQARQWKEEPEPEPSLASEELFIQLARLYEIPGAKPLIEAAQQEALRVLDR